MCRHGMTVNNMIIESPMIGITAVLYLRESRVPVLLGYVFMFFDCRILGLVHGLFLSGFVGHSRLRILGWSCQAGKPHHYRLMPTAQAADV